MHSLKISVLALAAVALLAGCGEKKDTTESSGASTEATPEAPKSEVSFITPKDGAAVKGALICKVKLKNFTIDPKAVGQSPSPGAAICTSSSTRASTTTRSTPARTASRRWR